MAQSRPIDISVSEGKKIYFASDQHFGAPDELQSKKREEKFINWLNEIKPNCEVLFLVGDLFDFWFEYKNAIPKGFVRVLGKLAEFSDAGIQIYFFKGNHDLWTIDYFEKELNFIVFSEKQEFNINGKQFLIAHGDGLGPDDKGFKRMKIMFTHPFFQFFYRWLHPDIGIPFGNYLSRRNKLISGEEDKSFLGEDKEWLILYSKQKLQEKHYDFFVYGHRHLPLEIELENNSKYLNLGDWIGYFTYAEFDGENLNLLKY